MESVKVQACATAIDVRFGHVAFKDKKQYEDALLWVKEDMMKIASSKKPQEPVADHPQSDPINTQNSDAKRQPNIWKTFDERVAVCTDHRTTSVEAMVRVNTEIDMLRKEMPVHRSTNIGEWYKNHQCQYPILSKICKIYLCTPATSVPSEHVFSICGQVVTDKRAKLSDAHVSQIIFLNKNWEK